jgi:hypothetical protein
VDEDRALVFCLDAKGPRPILRLCPGNTSLN